MGLDMKFQLYILWVALLTQPARVGVVTGVEAHVGSQTPAARQSFTAVSTGVQHILLPFPVTLQVKSESMCSRELLVANCADVFLATCIN